MMKIDVRQAGPQAINLAISQLLDVELRDWVGEIAHAWELVEHVDTVQLSCGAMGGWRCFLYSLFADGVNEEAKADTAPLAICRAFLLASGITQIEVDDDQT